MKKLAALLAPALLASCASISSVPEYHPSYAFNPDHPEEVEVTLDLPQLCSSHPGNTFSYTFKGQGNDLVPIFTLWARPCSVGERPQNYHIQFNVNLAEEAARLHMNTTHPGLQDSIIKLDPR